VQLELRQRREGPADDAERTQDVVERRADGDRHQHPRHVLGQADARHQVVQNEPQRHQADERQPEDIDERHEADEGKTDPGERAE